MAERTTTKEQCVKLQKNTSDIQACSALIQNTIIQQENAMAIEMARSEASLAAAYEEIDRVKKEL